MKQFIQTILLIAFFYPAMAQTNSGSWKAIQENEITTAGEREIVPEKYQVFRLVNNDFKNTLFSAPHEKDVALNNSTTTIQLPMPDGSFQTFRVVNSPVMAPELAAKYPQIQTFNVQGVDDPGAYGKLDWNEFGFHAMIRRTAGDFFIDPYSRNNVNDYIVYNTADFKKDESKKSVEVDVIKSEEPKKKSSLNVTERTAAGSCAGSELRTYRLAVACTGEYAKAATGSNNPTTAQILSKVVTTVNRVDGVYETEVAVKLVLIGNVDTLLFADESTDPFNGNNDSYILLNESQFVIDDLVGNSSYDIGHTFSTGGGGVAYLGSVCNSNSKAKGITGSPYPVGDPYDIDYVAHEMGHQFHGNHTFTATTGSCQGNGNGSTQVEPGSGVTIMGYAGICGFNDIASNSIPYFHTISFDEIIEFITIDGGSQCPVVTSTGNNAPVVTGSITYTVPKSTPFILTGSATDPDGDSLSYQWEEIDLGSNHSWNSGDAPYFRSYVPNNSLSRMFPRLNVVMSGNLTSTKGEYAPPYAQTLDFRFIARDNKMGGGGVCYANTQVQVASSGPFNITYPNVIGIVWPSASTQTITWNVNGTNASPVNCSTVNILLSMDNGNTYTTLIANTTNDGSEVITVPTVPVNKTTCRIKVEAVGNVFFDINDKIFTISSSAIGMDEYVLNNGMNVYLWPNPVNDILTIKADKLDKNSKTVLSVYNLLGEKVMSEELPDKDTIEIQYNVGLLSAGVYFVELRNANQRSVTKLLKE